jgi:hypothetical protein
VKGHLDQLTLQGVERRGVQDQISGNDSGIRQAGNVGPRLLVVKEALYRILGLLLGNFHSHIIRIMRPWLIRVQGSPQSFEKDFF